MKYSIAGVLIALAVIVGTACAQPGPPTRGGGRGFGAQSRNYDPTTVETVSGEVVRVERSSSTRGMSQGVHLVIRTAGDHTLSVRLGPAWYVDRQDLKIAANDRVEVKGSRVTIDGEPALIAATVKKGERTLVLRDEAGIPAWSGARRRGAQP